MKKLLAITTIALASTLTILSISIFLAGGYYQHNRPSGQQSHPIKSLRIDIPDISQTGQGPWICSLVRPLEPHHLALEYTFNDEGPTLQYPQISYQSFFEPTLSPYHTKATLKYVTSSASAANTLRQTGTVTLMVDISPIGKITNIRVLSRSHHVAIIRAAKRTLRKATYTPAMHNGSAIWTRDQIIKVTILPYKEVTL